MKRKPLIFLIFWLIFIFVMSSFPAETSSSQSSIFVRPIRNLFPSSDLYTVTTIVRKIAHFTEYAVLGFLIVTTFSAYVNRRFFSLFVIGFCALYSVSDEIHQIFVSGRSAQFTDVLIDVAGSIFGIITFWLFTKCHLSCYNRKYGRNRS